MCFGVMTSLMILMLLFGNVDSYNSKQLVHGKRLKGSDSVNLIQLSIEECLNECFLRPNCGSFNYNRRLGICELNPDNNDSSVALVTLRGWVFGDLQHVTRMNLGNCENITCPRGKFCKDLGVGYDCKPIECIPTLLKTVGNSIKFGNIYEPGAKVTFDCIPMHVRIGPVFTTCLENGSWSEFPTCEPLCENPNILLNTFLKILQVDILSEHGVSTHQGRQFGNSTSFGNIRDTSNVSFVCSTTEYGTVLTRITCNNSVWEFSPACPSNDISCHLLTACDETSSIDCIENVCSCPNGKSYQYSSMSCVNKCINGFADTFTKIDQVGIFEKDYILIDGISLEECVSKCITSGCGIFEYGEWSGEIGCFLRDKVFTDYSSSIDEWTTGNLYLRDCE